ncbi:hypothetical protein C2845_PM13G05810 [Panicum miliaceum]|uniref:Uncharacterized protein n=1 Tax=Panicum miliaceum TaxID=4540 RepID=A0A3L6RG84_PANMI|nr:hypothetical protein C2845_PM13G05810 [Panicum miliaceum]
MERARSSVAGEVRFSIGGREMEGTTTQATDIASRFARLRAKFEEGSGAGSTKQHPNTEGEEKAFKSAVAGAGTTEHPRTEGEENKSYRTEGEEKKAYEVVDLGVGFARVRDDPEMPGGVSMTRRPCTSTPCWAVASPSARRPRPPSRRGPGRRGRR